jgi:hypothetical protein
MSKIFTITLGIKLHVGRKYETRDRLLLFEILVSFFAVGRIPVCLFLGRLHAAWYSSDRHCYCFLDAIL